MRLGAVVGLFSAVAIAMQPATAATACADHLSYSALGAAAGVRTAVAAPGTLLVPEAAAGSPESQAEYDSKRGSNGFAGAAFSELVTGNIGLAGVDPNDIPVFVLSKHPTEPEEEKTNPSATIRAESDAEHSMASTTSGGTGADEATAGRVTTRAYAGCGSDGTVEAEADNDVDLFDVAGVLSIGSVSSHAAVSVAPDGSLQLEASMDVDGAAVLGQRVAISDEGLVTGEETLVPVDGDPLTQALVDAGITVRYIAAELNEETGEAFAPGLEISTFRSVDGVGSGPQGVIYTVGRAYARASARFGSPTTEPAPPPPAPEVSPSQIVGAPPTTSVVVDAPDTTSITVPPAPTISPSSPSGQASASPVVSVAGQRIADWSILPVYTALCLVVLLVIASRLGAGALEERLFGGRRSERSDPSSPREKS